MAATGANPLMIGGQVIPGPAAPTISKAKASELFKKLEDEWDWSPEITNYIVNSVRVRNLYEFLEEFKDPQSRATHRATELKVDASLAPLTGPERSELTDKGALPKIYFTRMFLCADSVAGTLKESEELLNKGIEAQLAAVDKTEVIRKWIARFWIRHRITFPFSQMPSYQLLSRLHREVSMRELQKYDMRKVKTLTFEKSARPVEETITDNVKISMAANTAEPELPQDRQGLPVVHVDVPAGTGHRRVCATDGPT
jgi:hypothetical protein